MPDIDISQFTVVQLKNWLNVLGLQTSGSKAELMARLQTLSTEARGDPPNGASFNSHQPPETELEEAASLPLQQNLEGTQEPLFDSGTMTSQAVDVIRTKNVSLLQKILDEIDANKSILQQLQAEIADVTSDTPNHAQQVQDVIESNIETSGNINSFACIDAVNANRPRVNSARDNFDIDDSSVGKHAKDNADQYQFTNVNKLLESPATTLALAKEVTMAYDGNSCARNWVTQLQNISRDSFGSVCSLLPN